jgi:LysR family transcriptional regulator, transcriptional activator for bauABCD operon
MLPQLQAHDVKLIKTFVAVAEAGGLSAAQVKLHRSLTAISSDIQTLEERLGNKLCRRGRSGFALTEFGRQVVEASQQLLEALDRFQLDIQPSRDNLMGDLRIAVHEGQINDPDFVLSEALRRFCGRPKNQVKVGVAISSHEQILQGILNNEIDVGFGFFNAEHPRIEFTSLYEERNLLYCAQGHPLFGLDPKQVSVEQVLTYPTVMRTRHPPSFYPSVLAGMTAAAIGKTPESRAYLISSGHYLGWLAPHQAERWISEGTFRPVLPEILKFDLAMQVAVKHVAVQPLHIGLFMKDFLGASRKRFPVSAPKAARKS